MYNVLAIALGGALGASSRYLLGFWIANKWPINFPLHTILINISGAFLLGFVNVLLLDKVNVSPSLRLGIGVGFLGAYTTFSTFGYEVFTMIEGGNYSLAFSYIAVSLVIGIAAVFVGVGAANLL